MNRTPPFNRFESNFGPLLRSIIDISRLKWGGFGTSLKVLNQRPISLILLLSRLISALMNSSEKKKKIGWCHGTSIEGLVKVCASDECLDPSIHDIKQFVNYSFSEEEGHRRALERQVWEMQDSISKRRSSPISTSWGQGHDSNSIALQLNGIDDRLSRVDEVIAHCCTLDVAACDISTSIVRIEGQGVGSYVNEKFNSWE